MQEDSFFYPSLLLQCGDRFESLQALVDRRVDSPSWGAASGHVKRRGLKSERKGVLKTFTFLEYYEVVRGITRALEQVMLKGCGDRFESLQALVDRRVDSPSWGAASGHVKRRGLKSERKGVLKTFTFLEYYEVVRGITRALEQVMLKGVSSLRRGEGMTESIEGIILNQPAGETAMRMLTVSVTLMDLL
ncbi:hypothetical protein CDAR_614751 [Caerostris darwini]|uniref:Uncharacterized protein n=1 Tax=Caerostris darwini TaxID=1538125 RepID=A0AAV4TR47_9ARAC|nr:hypothetical protein CDAR_614751 [Caerostris darwini]